MSFRGRLCDIGYCQQSVLFLFQLSAMGENALMRSIGIKTKWAITLQCDISEAMEMKRGLSFVLQ